MAKYRPIKTCFWSDEFISTLTANAKLLYLYLLTNERTTLCGIYRLPIQYLYFETGLDKPQIEKAVKELESKIVYKDGWAVVKNYQKHQSASPKIKAGIKREMSEIPQAIANLLYGIDTLSIGIDKPILKPIYTTTREIWELMKFDNEALLEPIQSLIDELGFKKVKTVAQKVIGAKTGGDEGARWLNFVKWCKSEKDAKSDTPKDIYSNLPEA
jgi:hypothetical protein